MTRHLLSVSTMLPIMDILSLLNMSTVSIYITFYYPFSDLNIADTEFIPIFLNRLQQVLGVQS